MDTNNIAIKSINTIRTLSMDAVQKANSGHPGAPMGLAPVAYALWQKILRYDPEHPHWPNRDRFVLSNGHASMLLYSLLHLAGIKRVAKDGKVTDKPAVSLEDIKQFRQLDSVTPGHPESHLTTGIETTTGPLGQGVANSVGMAIASRWLAANYNKTDVEALFDFNVYAICGDGCLMEGVSAEAASTAGHLKLSNLCWIYDNNHITIEGNTSLAFTEDVATRFKGYGWEVAHVTDANDLNQLESAFSVFQKTNDRPTLIIVDSHIAWGSPNKQDTHGAHGEPLGEEEIRLTKKAYGWPEDAQFLVPDGVYEDFQANIGKRGQECYESWQKCFSEYQEKHPDLAKQINEMLQGKLPANWDKDLPTFPADAKGQATRNISGKVLNAVAKTVPWLIGGSADLAPSTKTLIDSNVTSGFSAENYGGRNLHFGVREHAMSAIVNGMAHCYVRPYASTFLVFSDYARGAIRLSALMEVPVIYIFTHDSISLGEDGPTHQPVEHLAALRAIPGLMVFRPADANEVTEVWRTVMPQMNHPAALVLTRQNIPTFDRAKYAPADGVAQGAYVLADSTDGKPQVLLLATGSEVCLCLEAFEQLKKEGIAARVVSMPCWELFADQSAEYQASVLPPDVKCRVSVEEGVTQGWSNFVGPTGTSIGMHSFGASGPYKEVQEKFGFTVAAVVRAAKDQLARNH